MTNSTKITCIQSELQTPPDTAISSVYILDSGVIELQTQNKSPPNLLNYRRISGTSYVDNSTGEIKEFRQSENRSGNKRSLSHLRRLLLHNLKGDGSELHITLTFSIPVADVHELSGHVKRFIGRLRNRYSIEYIAILDAHESGNLHLHLLLLKRNGGKLFIPYCDIDSIWGHGRIWGRRVRKADNLPYYFTTKEKVERLRFYPPRTRLFRCSAGIKKVVPLKISYKDARKLVSGLVLNHAKTIRVMQNNVQINCITYEQFTSNTKSDERIGKKL